jgi:hypothetical protein
MTVLKALTIGTVLAAGTTPRPVTLVGQPARYQTASAHRGLPLEVSVPVPAGTEAPTVQTAG